MGLRQVLLENVNTEKLYGSLCFISTDKIEETTSSYPTPIL